MPKNFNALPTASPEDDAREAMWDAQFGEDGHEHVETNATSPEAEATEADATPEESVEGAAERVSFATLTEQGAEAIENLKDKYGAQYEALKDTAKTKLRGFGRAAGAMAKKAGLFAVGAGVAGIGAGMAAASRAKQSINDRRAQKQALMAKRIEQARFEQTQNEAFDSYSDNIAYSQDHEDSLAENETKKQDQEDAFASYQENIDYTEAREAQDEAFASYGENIDKTARREANEAIHQEYMDGLHGEALEDNDQFDADKAEKQAAYDKRVAARYSSYTALLRKNARRERMDKIRNTGSEAYQKARSKGRQIGRAIASFAKRSGSAVVSGARAAKASWQETAA